MINIDEIKKIFKGKISLGEPMSKYTSFLIGGPADYYFEPVDKEDVIKIISYLQGQNFPFVAIGKGTNLLVNDDGIRGAVVNLESALKLIRADGNCIYAEAGVSLNRFVDFCIQQELKGVEMLAGIPGTIGGAIIMNAGAFGGEISNYLTDAEIVRDGMTKILTKEDIGFSYRHSSFSTNDVVLSARFKLQSGNKEEIMKTRNELVLQRNRKHPINYPNCGSVFKNPQGMPAAKLIEDVRLKGVRSGNAQISEVLLELEVKLLGFSNNNLSKVI
ncbi:MAG: UDP-N-acetylmuramate dehydrogenase [Ignavibacteriales bacterium]|nr:UDP-N-acetylmuramate dehydrogenase [Ignavibacteriales bacterium]